MQFYGKFSQDHEFSEEKRFGRFTHSTHFTHVKHTLHNVLCKILSGMPFTIPASHQRVIQQNLQQ